MDKQADNDPRSRLSAGEADSGVQQRDGQLGLLRDVWLAAQEDLEQAAWYEPTSDWIDDYAKILLAPAVRVDLLGAQAGASDEPVQNVVFDGVLATLEAAGADPEQAFRQLFQVVDIALRRLGQLPPTGGGDVRVAA